MTKTGAVIGTLSYWRPEQGLGHSIDERTDISALGMVLCEMLTGEKAFTANLPGALIYQHLYADVPQLPRRLSAYQELIKRTLAQDPDERYRNAGELVAARAPFCA